MIDLKIIEDDLFKTLNKKIVIDYLAGCRRTTQGMFKLLLNKEGGNIEKFSLGSFMRNGSLKKITGDINTVTVTDLDVVDKTITLASGATTLANTNAAGIQFGSHSSAPTLTWDNSSSRLSLKRPNNLIHPSFIIYYKL